MLQPSDTAPKEVTYNQADRDTSRLVFSTDNISFPENGGLRITFLGIKNDTSRDGFEVEIPPLSNPKLDPALGLKAYLTRTEKYRVPPYPVFIALHKPYGALSSVSIANILNQVIQNAGLDRSVYSAKSFRPTGATRAIEAGCDPDKVRRLGRWKTSSVFFEHYVHDKPPQNITDCSILPECH